MGHRENRYASMKLARPPAALLALLLFSYGTKGIADMKAEIDVEVINRSSHDMDDVSAHFGEYTCGWGWVVRNSTKDYAFYPHPITFDSELHWNEEGKHRLEVSVASGAS